MTNYTSYDIFLTESQKKSLQRPGQVILRFTSDQLYNNINASKLLLTKQQINKIEKCKQKKKGVEIKISKRQIHKNQIGGFLPLLAAAAKFVAPAAVAALSGMAGTLASKAADRIVGNGVNLLVPSEDVIELQNAIGLLESKGIIPEGSSKVVDQQISQKGGAFLLPLISTLLGNFLPTIFGKGVYLPWEKN